MKMYIFITAFFCILDLNECVAQLEPFGLQGETVTSISTLPIYYFYCGCEFNICASTEENGVYLRDISQPDSIWKNLGLKGKSNPILTMRNWAAGPVDFQTIFTAVNPDISHGDSTIIYKFYYHFDTTWTPASDGLTFDSSSSPRSLLSFNYGSHVGTLPLMFLYASKIYRYDEYFLEWALVSLDYKWNALAISQIYLDGVVWAGGTTDTQELIIAKSTNFGDTWILFSLDEFHSSCTSIAIDPINTDIVYFSIEGEIIKTTNGGLNWFKTGLQDKSATFTSIIVDQYNNDHILFGGYTFGNNFLLYESYNQGSSWTKIEPASVLPAITGMIADTLENTFSVFIGTRGNGVFRYKSSLTFLEEEPNQTVPTEFQLSQNYPNPFNPTSTIKYDIPEDSRVQIKVFDVLGKEVSELVNEQKPAGSYEVEFKSTVGGLQLASGIYFYRLQAGNFISTKKMILIK